METETVFLSLDPSTNFGWCLRLPDNTKHFGTWNLGSSMPNGTYFLNLWKRLTSLLKTHGVMTGFDVTIIIEQANFNAQGASHALSEGWLAVVQLFCSTYGFRSPKPVTVGEWRSRFLTHNNFLPSSRPPKFDVPAAITGTDAKKRWTSKQNTAWYKTKVMEKCFSLGIQPEDDNAADAVGILFWAYSGGVARQVKRREVTKAKKKAKRDQKSFVLDGA